MSTIVVCCSYSKTVIFPCYKFLLYPPKRRISLMISLINKKSAFYETSTYCNWAKINSARKYEFGQCAKINGAKINGIQNRRCAKKMGLILDVNKGKLVSVS